jgi:hypothetical protein
MLICIAAHPTFEAGVLSFNNLPQIEQDLKPSVAYLIRSSKPSSGDESSARTNTSDVSQSEVGEFVLRLSQVASVASFSSPAPFSSPFCCSLPMLSGDPSPRQHHLKFTARFTWCRGFWVCKVANAAALSTRARTFNPPTRISENRTPNP